jgi:cytochrome c-type biogenesis protein CcmH
MNRKDSSKQEPAGRFWGKPRMFLVLAALIAAAAIGYAALREEGPGPAPPPEDIPSGAIAGIDALERQAAADPSNGAIRQRLGQAYFDDGRFADAVRAIGEAAKLDPRRAELWSALGEAQVMASKVEPMPAEAAANFAKALSLDARDPRARYFTAVKKDLAGDHAGAIEGWLGLLADTPQGAPWETDLRRTIEQVGKINRIDVATRLAAVKQPKPAMPTAARGIPGPSAQDLAAAAAIAPSEQRQMAENMVARLESRLSADSGNVDGWIMLMRSRITLGQPEQAAAALRSAIAANPAKADLLRRQAAVLGLR